MRNDRVKRIRWQRRKHRRAIKRRNILRLRKITQDMRLEQLGQILSNVPLTTHPKAPRPTHTLSCPARLNLRDDFAETIDFMQRVREVAAILRGKFRVDLRPLTDITAATALMLVAEFDRWREFVPQDRLRAIDPEDWNPTVRKRLKDMGFFDLLKAHCGIEDGNLGDEERFLRFRSGHGSEGGQAKELRLSIEELGPKLRDWNALYDGLVEAMTNVKQHAYHSNARIRRWWMSASVNIKSGRLTVMFLDHGLSIPKTLPHSDLWETVRGWTLKVGASLTGLPLSDDAELIRAAMSVERSRTELDYRGNGLHDIQAYVESHNAYGRLRIISGYGQYMYEKRPGLAGDVQVKSLPKPLRGTFIEWTIEEYAEANGDDAN